MRINKKTMALISVCNYLSRINTQPDYQRPLVWSRGQKRLLIDTILRGYDIPKLYWLRKDGKPERFDVVDGQQRLCAISEFFSNEFNLMPDSEPIDGEEIGSLYYKDLPLDLRVRFDDYNLDIAVIEDASEDEVAEVFLRLQNGSPLKAQEKRNAISGSMREFVKDITKHQLFSRFDFDNKRFVHDLLAAQIVLLEMEGGPTNVKNADLTKMYESNRNFDTKSSVANGVKRKLNILSDIFIEKDPALSRNNITTLYCVISELEKQFSLDDVKEIFHDWVVAFELQKDEERSKDEESGNIQWLSYLEKTSHSTDAGDNIRSRMEFMLEDIFDRYPNLAVKDRQRGFTAAQRRAIWRRDKGVCQLRIKCDGIKTSWDDWDCDHITPHSKGGRSSVSNGQVACPACNRSKGAAISDALE